MKNEQNNISNTSNDCKRECIYVFPKSLIPGQVVKDLVEYHHCKKQSEDFSDKDNITEPENESPNIEAPESEEDNRKKKWNWIWNMVSAPISQYIRM